ncbi:hypothetical protein QCE62_00325 [Caballeronia sp. LZ033]|uniref:hypothetical protein n=1 Tax=Caballeronia sp. LZ033 TaxID=3038566 RepID=UPI0028637FF9|nr:hypothetical protein [Caballeronia sp. LZ033]MDR5812033.1 hypothetical protein [Caballeronia sp. LZ033]
MKGKPWFADHAFGYEDRTVLAVEVMLGSVSLCVDPTECGAGCMEVIASGLDFETAEAFAVALGIHYGAEVTK